ncbi:hypothetical protein BS78_09G036500 [Paspalum vaginatum]|nr:hypothetical protein BS78_09G036500 [Paspalum vaginatum]KAJ1261529.1 hypothetical protein BS78_09G036500 [Paspalum vaginatum]
MSSPPALGLGPWPAAPRPSCGLARGAGVAASARPAPRRPEGRGDGARLSPRRSRHGTMPSACLLHLDLAICLGLGGLWERGVRWTWIAAAKDSGIQVMSFFLSLTIVWFSAHRALHELETTANKLARVFAEEVPGTLSSLKLSLLEISDLTSQLKDIRNRFAMSRFGKKGSSTASSR